MSTYRALRNVLAVGSCNFCSEIFICVRDFFKLYLGQVILIATCVFFAKSATQLMWTLQMPTDTKSTKSVSKLVQLRQRDHHN